ncbi:MAG: ABATE domain-containing protein [Anaerolineae bacterium]
MGEQEMQAGALALLGGRTSLDFANTVDWHASDEPVEYLTSYAALLAWGQHTGILEERQVERLLEEAGRRPREAAAMHERAVVLREAIYRIFAAISSGSAAADDDLAVLNAELSRTLACSRIVPSGGGYTWDWIGQEAALDRVLWPVVRDAADLLTSEDLARVGQCADDRCGWLFLDTSRNHSRRWCSMEDCGNRAKARRYYRRSRTSEEG